MSRPPRAAAWRLWPLALLAAPALFAQAPSGEPFRVLFRDVTREAGVTFVHHAAPEKIHRRVDERRSGAPRFR